ncbi:MAG: ferritin, partial [Staphylococcus epidermidis]|nr:ferritin [Staphylococcus epidermidis]
YDYIFQKNGVVELKQIPMPTAKYDGVIDVFQKGYEHEQLVTKKIYNLADIAHDEKEHATMSLLKWFIDEQVEEENSFNALLKKVRRSEGNPAALYLMDDELASRVYTPPTNA